MDVSADEESLESVCRCARFKFVIEDVQSSDSAPIGPCLKDRTPMSYADDSALHCLVFHEDPQDLACSVLEKTIGSAG